MNLYRIRLRPLSAWVTPWQSDTLTGLLCWSAARLWGAQRLDDEIIQPALRGEPAFVVSDAFPGDYLPIPAISRVQPLREMEAKTWKSARWITREAFTRLQQGEAIQPSDLVSRDPWCTNARVRNTIARDTSTAGSSGGELFEVEETLPAVDPVQPFGVTFCIYARMESAFEDRFHELIDELGATGFGADASIGLGQFEIESKLEPVTDLDVTDANGVVCLSSFQPSTQDPTEGYWTAFVKYGKLGPGLGLDNVFKRPIVLLRPGAFFYHNDPPAFLGRAIPPDELLSPDTSKALRGRGVTPVHVAFGVAIPFKAVSLHGDVIQ